MAVGVLREELPSHAQEPFPPRKPLKLAQKIASPEGAGVIPV
jgi:hypothetical protein